jgi:hypothetical protein
MTRYQDVVDALARETGTPFRPASPKGLAELRAFNLPESVIGFYASHEPEEPVEGQVRLWPIEHILAENRAFGPGAYVSPLGYVVFASTVCGDAYCFDLNQLDDSGAPRIVLITHEGLGEDITPDVAAELAKPVASHLEEFLHKMLREEVDEDCIH